MYSYQYDPQTGGILLINTPSNFSKEPRPVFASELNILGFNKFYKYNLQDDIPYMWAEANCYIYKGERVAKIEGGSYCEKPELIIERDETGIPILALGTELEQIDIKQMISKNELILNAINKKALTRISFYYEKCRHKINCFYVAFSGGKDSIVLLDLVRCALPENAFFTLFGDTGMEYPDTYALIDKIKQDCDNYKIPFYTAKSHLHPQQTWKAFGPPSKSLRWCCSVHKTTPQILKIREIKNLKNCVSLAFVGIREHESLARSRYKIFNYGKKQQGQFSLNPILEWSSAEVWLYIFKNKLRINDAYKKGNSRVGCLCCPMCAEGLASWFRSFNYPKEYLKYISLIRESISEKVSSDKYINSSIWVSRTNGRDLKNNESKISEDFIGNDFVIDFVDKYNNFYKWIETIKNLPFKYDIIKHGEKIKIRFQSKFYGTTGSRILRYISHKASYCIGCKECEANCRNGCISFDKKFQIDNCNKCGACNLLDEGCLLYNSLRLPKFETKKMKSINTLTDFTPTTAWINKYFNKGIEFILHNDLGPMQIRILKRFLENCNLLDKQKETDLYYKVKKLGINTPATWSIILINLIQENPQFKWYIKNLPINQTIAINEFEHLLSELNLGERAISSIRNAFSKICELPIGKIIKFGSYAKNGKDITYLRTKPLPPDPRIFLYGLYKFAEGCKGFYEFTLGRLMDFEMESDAISPSEIFALSRDETSQYLRGLAHNYPEYVLNFSSTHGLEVLNLNPDKKSDDVLSLLEPDHAI